MGHSPNGCVDGKNIQMYTYLQPNFIITGVRIYMFYLLSDSVMSWTPCIYKNMWDQGRVWPDIFHEMVC